MFTFLVEMLHGFTCLAVCLSHVGSASSLSVKNEQMLFMSSWSISSKKDIELENSYWRFKIKFAYKSHILPHQGVNHGCLFRVHASNENSIDIKHKKRTCNVLNQRCCGSQKHCVSVRFSLIWLCLHGGFNESERVHLGKKRSHLLQALLSHLLNVTSPQRFLGLCVGKQSS